MHDSKVLSAAIASREAYEKVRKHVGKRDFGAHVSLWWKLLDQYYQGDKRAYAVDLEILKQRGKRELPEKHIDALMEVVNSLPEPVSPVAVANELLDLKRYNVEMELAGMIAGRDDRKKLQQKTEELQQLYQATSLNSSELVIAGGLDELDEYFLRDNLIRLAPTKLNELCEGGAMRGDHIILFARPEVGKTLFTVNMVGQFLKDKHKVLYVGNEDKIQKIQYRIRSNLSNFTRADLDKLGDRGVEEANRRAKKHNMGTHLHMAHLHPGSVSEIDELCDEYKPDILVIDQIRNVGGAGDGITSRLNQVAIEVRALLGKYDMLGVSTTQANAPEGSEPKEILQDFDVDSSKTGLPAQADLLLGIGATSYMMNTGQRTVNLCKNKLSGNHDNFACRFDPLRSQVK